MFYVRPEAGYNYDVVATNYTSDLHRESDKNLTDVAADVAIAVELSGV